MSRSERTVARAATAAYVVAGAGLAALVTFGLHSALGQPWGTLDDLSLLVMTLALAPLMLAFWELGGVTPTPLALAAQASGWIAVLAWCAVQSLMILGVVTFDHDVGARGSFAVEAAALVVIGLWIAGANLLAGPWLNRVRWLGVASGIGFVVFALGLLMGGVNYPLTLVGGVGYRIIFPIWALLIGRLLAARSSQGPAARS
jgi:hypothetical protein